MMEMPAILYVLYEMNTAGQINASTKMFFLLLKMFVFPNLKIYSFCLHRTKCIPANSAGTSFLSSFKTAN